MKRNLLGLGAIFLCVNSVQAMEKAETKKVHVVPVQLRMLKDRWKGQEAGYLRLARMALQGLSTLITDSLGKKIGEFDMQAGTVTTYFGEGSMVLLDAEEFFTLLQPQVLPALKKKPCVPVDLSNTQLRAIKARWKGQDDKYFKAVMQFGEGLSPTVTNNEGEKIGNFDAQTGLVATFLADGSKVILVCEELRAILEDEMFMNGMLETSELKGRWNGQEDRYFEAAKRVEEGLSTICINNQGEKIGEFNAQTQTVTTYFADGSRIVLSFLQFFSLLQPKMQLTNSQLQALKIRWNEQRADLLKGVLRAQEGRSTHVKDIQGLQMGKIEVETATVTTYFADGSTLMLGFEQFCALMQPEINLAMSQEYNKQLELSSLN